MKKNRTQENKSYSNTHYIDELFGMDYTDTILHDMKWKHNMNSNMQNITLSSITLGYQDKDIKYKLEYTRLECKAPHTLFDSYLSYESTWLYTIWNLTGITIKYGSVKYDIDGKIFNKLLQNLYY